MFCPHIFCSQFSKYVTYFALYDSLWSRDFKRLVVKMFEAIKLEKDEQTLSDFKHFLFFSVKVVQSFL